MSCFLPKDGCECVQQGVVLAAGADADPEAPREAGRGREVAHQDGEVVAQAAADPGGVWHARQHEVGGAGPHAHAVDARESRREALALRDDVGHACRELVATLDRHARHGLRQDVLRVDLAHRGQDAYDRGVGREVAAAQARQAKRLGQGAQHHQARVVGDPPHKARVLAGKLDVRLVHQHHRVGLVEHAAHDARVQKVAGGVVWRGQDDQRGTLGSLDQRLGVDGEGLGVAPHGPGGRLAHRGEVRVLREVRRAGDQRAIGPAEGKQQVEQQLVATVTNTQVVARDAVSPGEKVAQVVCHGVGVAVERGPRHGLAHGARERLGRLVGVLVGGQVHAAGREGRVVRLEAAQGVAGA